eukprot:8009233-Pyramimonas_sp.AAC.1
MMHFSAPVLSRMVGSWACCFAKPRQSHGSPRDCGKPRSRLLAGQWQSVDRKYTSNIRWNI